MKKLSMIAMAALLCTAGFAQKGKDKHKKHEKSSGQGREVILNEAPKQKGSYAVWEGTTEKGGPKPSKNQPAKVRQAFAADYPNASNVSWSKYRGDWTATFSNGLTTSTAVYHANGRRKDTRTPVSRPQLPRTIDEIIRKRPAIQLGDIIRIEVPDQVNNLFRIKTIEGGSQKFTVYDTDGKVVNYDY
jgi:hypothetical protein